MYGDLRRLPKPLDEDLQIADGVTLAETGQFGDAIDLGENFSPDPITPVRVGLNVTAVDFAGGDESYVLEGWESADNVTFTRTCLRVVLESTGTYHLIDGLTARYFKLLCTQAGATSSLTADAWLAAA